SSAASDVYKRQRERCSAGRFLSMFRETLDDLRARGRAGLAVGGAGLYVDACLGRFHDLPPADEAFRARALRIEEQEGPGSLHRRLCAVDPATASRLAPRDLQRIVRALEVSERAGRPMSELFAAATEAACPPETPVILLDRLTRDLYTRIEARCEAMLAAGLLREVRGLLEAGVQPDAAGMKSVGYAEWIAYLSGRIDHDQAHELFLRNSRRYAKRQRTWFRNRHPDRIEIRIPEGQPPEATAAQVLEVLDARERRAGRDGRRGDRDDP
ncbi:MAG: tRNA (adenosine(37)-N6)-dimethylallyltransferase MiaA, partial [Candidatus Eisenbacteria bacterium]|nr:tRNA (adenosine(37)-N6)-dimethylallyltransferase MiaA [Candidatus Eisenbacteria bacterium]